MIRVCLTKVESSSVPFIPGGNVYNSAPPAQHYILNDPGTCGADPKYRKEPTHVRDAKSLPVTSNILRASQLGNTSRSLEKAFPRVTLSLSAVLRDQSQPCTRVLHRTQQNRTRSTTPFRQFASESLDILTMMAPVSRKRRHFTESHQ